MGTKRPLHVEDFPKISFKQPKQLDHNKMQIFTTENFPSHSTTPGVDSQAEANSNICKLHFDVGPENGDTDYAPVADNELDGNVPLPLITRSNIPEDSKNQDTSFLPYFPRDIDFSMPYRPPEHFEDPYVILLNRSPRKEVPIGPDHQAEIPQWDMNASEKGFSGSNSSLDYKMREKMGVCIVKMPELNNPGFDSVKIGNGRTDCSCPDVGSTRCVQQHISEARERLRETIGDEIFTELGFYDMGEVVANKWSPDEPIFHPTRKKSEIVSFYFNVFMLRKRAAQNRSYLLEIDSDNDEVWSHEDGSKGSHEYGLAGENEDSITESFHDQGCDVGSIDGSVSEYGKMCKNEGSDNNHGVCDGDVFKQGDDVAVDGGKGPISGQ